MIARFKSIIHKQITSIHAAALMLGAAGLLSRLLGLLRDRLLAAHFGAGRELDIYYASFQIPDFLGVVFLLGAASSAVLPVFQEYLKEDPKRARMLISRVSAIFFLGAALLSALAFLFAPLLVGFIVPGFSSADRHMTVGVTRIMLLSPVLFGISGIVSSVVESFGRFLAYGLTPIFYNIGIIIGILFFLPVFGLKGLGMGVLLGAFFNFLLLFIPAHRLGFSPRIVFPRFDEGVRRVVRISFPRVISVSLAQVTLLALIAVGSTLVQGSIALFTLAQNLYFVPVGIFAISYTVPLFPRMSRAFLSRDGEAFFREFYLGVRSIFFWLLPSSAVLFVLRAHVVRVAYGAGAFSWPNTRMTAALVAILIFGLLARGLVILLIKGFYALGDTRTPLLINLGTAILSIGGAIWCVNFLSHPSAAAGAVASFFRIADLPSPEVLGLAIGYTIGMIGDAAFLWWAFARKARTLLSCRLDFPSGALLKIFAASLVAGAAAYAVRANFSAQFPLITFVQVLVQGFVSGVIGLAAYFGALIFLKSEDARGFLQSFRKRLLKVKMLPKGWIVEEEQ